MRACAALVMFVLSHAGTPASAAEPVVALWYRGTPAGTPRLDDLAAIKEAGFEPITWPSSDAGTVAYVSRFAQTVGLLLVIQPDRPDSPPAGRVTIDVAGLD